MTSSQILMGWGVYLVGAMACTLALWLITGSINPRVRRLLRTGTFALLVTPWSHSTDPNLLLPALWAMIYDGLSAGFPEMARAGLPLVIVTAACSIIATSLPASGKERKKQQPSNQSEQQPERQPKERHEPTI